MAKETLRTPKFVFVTGGVVSGIGKGITAASLGRLLKSCGLKVTAQKLDPYINVDSGRLNPIEHGEVFVTEDGAEADLDLGHYERFIDENLSKYSTLSSGRVYWNVLTKERNGEYQGKTVQVIPHITDEIKSFIYTAAETSQADVVITEIGGTTGDIESLPFLEAVRQVHAEVGKGNSIFIHVTLVPYLNASHEYKSKPTQHSVKELQSLGIFPDIIVIRSENHVGDDIKKKIALFCNVREDSVIEGINTSMLYEIPLLFEKQKFCEIVLNHLGIEGRKPDMSEWEAMLDRVASQKEEIVIGLVGKYTKLHDAYYSVVQSLYHAGNEIGAKVEIKWIESDNITQENVTEVLDDVDGVILPGGFGERGVGGMIEVCRFLRENNIPFFGIGLGMQASAIEFARNVLGLDGANSTEFDSAARHPVIYQPHDQTDGRGGDRAGDKAGGRSGRQAGDKAGDRGGSLANQGGAFQNGNAGNGGAMRLGSYPCSVKAGALLEEAYGTDEISERHRHRYELNADYREAFEKAGMIVSGTSPDGKYLEVVEIPANDFYIGVQYHPEFKSRPNRAHPLFRKFAQAVMKHSGSID